MKRYLLPITLLGLTGLSQAAVITTHLKIDFNGTLVGTTYTPGAGEVVNNGTFAANGTPTVSSGIASLDGSAGSDINADGFKYSTTLGSLSGTNWVAEAVVAFDTFGSGQRTVIDVQGDTDFRILNNGTQLQASYWDGTNTGSVTTPLPVASTYVHLALVWDATATSLTAYVNGVSIGTANNNAFTTPDPTNISFGYLGRTDNVGRGIDGSLDTISFSTFTGTFNPTTDFAVTPVPESSVALLGGLGLIGLLRRRR